MESLRAVGVFRGGGGRYELGHLVDNMLSFSRTASNLVNLVYSLFSFWSLLHCEMQLQSVGEKFKAFCVVVCGPVHLRCMIHVERLSVGLLTLKQELWLFLVFFVFN